VKVKEKRHRPIAAERWVAVRLDHDAASHPRRRETSATQLPKTKAYVKTSVDN
jgi:hypothetical protein